MYTKLVLEHFTNPRNVGEVEDADGAGETSKPSCGDVVRISVAVADDRITEVKFKTFGCPAAVAASSVVTEMATGKTLAEAAAVSAEAVAEALDGLPPKKLYCSDLAVDALHLAIRDYLAGSGREAEVERLFTTPPGAHRRSSR